MAYDLWIAIAQKEKREEMTGEAKGTLAASDRS